MAMEDAELEITDQKQGWKNAGPAGIPACYLVRDFPGAAISIRQVCV